MAATASLHYQATGMNQVVDGSKKIESAVNNVKNAQTASGKAASKSGIAILEASRAIEDFSMAGMRGALNNIPMVLMNIGAAAGVAAGATIGLVLAMEGMKALEAYLAGVHAEMERRNDIGFRAINIMQMENDLREDSIKKAQKYKDVIESFNSEKSFAAHNKSLDEGLESMQMEIGHIEKLISLEKERLTEKERGEKIALAVKEKSITAAYTEAINSNKTLKAEKEHLDLLKEKKKEQETLIALDNTDDIKSINKRVRDAGVQETLRTQRLLASHLPEAQEYNYTTSQWQKKNLSNSELDALAPKLDDFSIMNARNSGLAEADKMFNQLTAGKTDQFKLQIQSLQIAEEKVKMLDEEIKKQEQVVKLQHQTTLGAESMAVLTKRKAEVDYELGQLQDKNKKKQGFDALQFRSTDGMMSDMGKRGLNADEVNNSLDILNVNKSMLSRLQGIERNTKRARSSYN